MADPADKLLAGYDPASGDERDPYAQEVEDFKRRMLGAQNAAVRRGLDYLPENRELPSPQFPFDPRAMSMLNMIKHAGRSAGNWGLDYNPQWSDMATPLGMAGVGTLLARPATHMVRPKEFPTAAAVRIGDQTFTGPSHLDAVTKAQAALGEDVVHRLLDNKSGVGSTDGFLTNAGRYVSREEAATMAGMPRVVGNGMVSEALEGGVDRARPTGRGYATTLTADAGKGSKVGNIVNASAQEVPFTQRLKQRVDAMRQDPAIGKGEMVAEISRMRGEEFRKLYALTRAEIAEMLGLSKNNSTLFETYRTGDMPTRRAPYRKGPVPQETIDQIMALRTGEKPQALRAISEQTGLPPELVSRLLRERGVELRPVLPEGQRYLADVPKETIDRIRQGRSGSNPRALEEIAADLGMPLSTLRSLITIHGIEAARAARPPVAHQRKLADQGPEVYNRVRELRNMEPRPTSIRKIGKELGLDPDMINRMRKLMRDQGIDVKSEVSSLPGTVLSSQSPEDRMLQPYD